jgi:hypothetical protein
LFSYFVKIIFGFLLLSFGHRVLFLLGFTDFWDLPYSAFSAIFFTGARFDLMVGCYLIMPLFAILCVGSWLIKKGHWTLKTSRYYFGVTYFAVGLVTLLDFAHMQIFADRLNVTGLSEGILHWSFRGLLNLRFILIALGLGVWTLGWCRRVTEQIPNYTWPLRVSTVLCTALFLALGARGTLMAHHLDLRHSVISSERILNVAVVPSSYALDQALRHRR